jgi:hypothetical protein
MGQRVGDSLAADGEWVREALVVDREANVESHRIESRDGQLKYFREEKLSDHVGRGSDKPALRAERAERKAVAAWAREERKAAVDAAYRNGSRGSTVRKR